jgi:hypothetical protein
MPDSLDPYVHAIEAAFDTEHDDIDVDDEAATSLLEFLSSASEKSRPPARGKGRRLVSLIIERDGR